MPKDVFLWTNPKTEAKTWYTNVWLPHGGKDGKGAKIKKAVGPSRREAEEVAAKIRASIRDTGISFATKTTTLNDFIPRGLQEKYTGRSSYDSAKRILYMFRDFVGNRRLSTISKGLLQRYVSKRLLDPVRSPFRGKPAASTKGKEWESRTTKRVQKPTVNREISYIIAMMNYAVKCDEIAANPLARFGKFRETDRIRKRYLHPSEIKAFCKEAEKLKDSPLLDIFLLAIYIGRRFSEIVGIKVQDYDRENGYAYFGKTKKGEPDNAPMPPGAQEILDRLHDKAVAAKVKWLFFNRQGTGPVSDVRTAFEMVKRQAGITGFRFHDTRHTSASFMVMSGVDYGTIAALIGHTTPTMVETRYGHLSPKHREASSVLYGAYIDRIMGRGDHEAAKGKTIQERPISCQVADLLSGLGVKAQADDISTA